VIDQLFAWLFLYGVPALFGILVVTAAGVPFPGTLLLLAVGSSVAQGEMKLWQVLVVGSAGVILGDQIGYCLGHWGGRRLVRRLTNKVGGADKIKRAEAFSERWGGAGVFFSRWLVGPLGPWINLSSGITAYPWPRFFLWDVLGEALWVVLYVMLGKIFSDRAQGLAELLGNLTWVIVGFIAATILGWKLFQYFRNSGVTQAEKADIAAESCISDNITYAPVMFKE
jgi:membrane protein DedA with SNARE-associated domain